MPPRWFEAREESPAQRAALLPLDAASLLYAAGARLHRAVHERGLRRPERLSCRVVSVGNLVVGGSGKTPLAAWLAGALRRRGHQVVLASRGYGRRGGDAVEIVSDGQHVLSTAERAGDEPMLLAAKAPGVPVLVGRDRALVGLRAISAFGAQVLILDDGFQHHRLARDVDLVVFDGASGLGNGRVLPRGPLREPASVLSRAHGIGIVDGPLSAGDAERIATLTPGAHRFSARRVPARVRPLAGGAGEPPASLAGRELGLLTGIARPASLRRSVEALGAKVVAERAFPDHHRYRARDLRGLADEAPDWITTEKDAVKILPTWAEGLDLRVLAIGIQVEDERGLLAWLEDRLRAHARGRDATVS